MVVRPEPPEVAADGAARGLPGSEKAVDLAVRAASGDLAATQDFLAYVWPTLSRVAAGILGANHPDVDDAVQQSMIALLRALPAFRGECHPAGYATRITLRVALRIRRGGKRELTRREALSQLVFSDDELAPSPMDDALGARRRELVRELVQELPEEQAEVVVLRIMLSWSLDEVARATGAPLNTVRSRLRLAKEALRRKVKSAPELCSFKSEP